MLEIMLYPFLALIAVSLLSGAYGCQMVWHKVACLGDTLSHGALLGIAFGVLTGLNEDFSLFLLSVLWAFFLWFLTKNRQNTSDTIMAFLMQASMAFAILIFVVSGNDLSLLHAFLGDVLMTDFSDVIFILCLDIVLAVILFFCWKKWVLIAVSPDLAKSQKINIGFQQFIFFTSIGFFVAVTMKLMGALLAPAFFIIPTMIARPLSKTPERMAILSSLFSCISSVLGLLFSFMFDLPTGATIVCFCVLLYVVIIFSFFIKNILRKHSSY